MPKIGRPDGIEMQARLHQAMLQDGLGQVHARLHEAMLQEDVAVCFSTFDESSGGADHGQPWFAPCALVLRTIQARWRSPWVPGASNFDALSCLLDCSMCR